ncbi:MAG: hypothetical protein J6Y68_02500 [Clostridia bacterium]|nr:hypothetical protein [Clostridia bacterium]
MENNYVLTSEEIIAEIKPLSSNAFLALLQRIWRWWLGVWYNFADKNPSRAALLQKFIVMFLLSTLVTIYQMLVMMFLPYVFTGLWYMPFVWPAIPLPFQDALGNPLNYAIFNEPVKYILDGQIVLASTEAQVVQMQANASAVYEISGFGNFIAFEIAVFTAQVINLPLQRNITFHSNGNVAVQAFWYFVGWVLISIGLNAVWGIMNPIMIWWNWNKFIIDIIKTVLTGGVSMVIFFFIFLVIFPDREKVAKKARKKADALRASSASKEVIEKAELNAIKKEEEAALETNRIEAYKKTSLASSRAVAYRSAVSNVKKQKEKKPNKKILLKLQRLEAFVIHCKVHAEAAIAAKKKANEKFAVTVDAIIQAKKSRGEDLSKFPYKRAGDIDDTDETEDEEFE